ncbi:MAG: hypothetical protein CM1200mP28_04050 [Deltaproteobacteria bacterium]|nr:MAG: hypothetical protein CM1200mP28_04050 [Deltaproteobacteria bacterium]
MNPEMRTNFCRFEGGVLGRVDDMEIVRGINVFPSAIENLVRGSDEVEEFRITVSTVKQMGHLTIELDLKKDTNLKMQKTMSPSKSVMNWFELRNKSGPHGSLPALK